MTRLLLFCVNIFSSFMFAYFGSFSYQKCHFTLLGSPLAPALALAILPGVHTHTIIHTYININTNTNKHNLIQVTIRYRRETKWSSVHQNSNKNTIIDNSYFIDSLNLDVLKQKCICVFILFYFNFYFILCTSFCFPLESTL